MIKIPNKNIVFTKVLSGNTTKFLKRSLIGQETQDQTMSKQTSRLAELAVYGRENR